MHPTQVIIDWSKGEMLSETESGGEVSKLIEWVRLYPRKGDIHVYLGQTLKSELGPMLQSTLQALGCRVTTKCA